MIPRELLAPAITDEDVPPVNRKRSGCKCDPTAVPCDECAPNVEHPARLSLDQMCRAECAQTCQDGCVYAKRGNPLDQKLALFRVFSDAACDELVRLLTEDREYLKQVARGRLVLGDYRLGDSLMFEYDQRRLMSEAVEELADGINYLWLRESRK